jgi:predicted N-acetyltransferase YhbS
MIDEGEAVIGYYSLAAGSVLYESAPVRVSKGLARHDIPVILMARFAVDISQQGKGLGRTLFFDALSRALAASESIGARAFFVSAKDPEARNFYEKFSMMPAPDNPLRLFLLFKDVRAALGIP